MRKIMVFILLVVLSLCLCGCPKHSEYVDAFYTNIPEGSTWVCENPKISLSFEDGGFDGVLCIEEREINISGTKSGFDVDFSTYDKNDGFYEDDIWVYYTYPAFAGKIRLSNGGFSITITECYEKEFEALISKTLVFNRGS